MALDPNWIPDYNIINKIYEGNNSTIYRAIKDNIYYTVKIVTPKNAQQKEQTLNEITILKFLSTPTCHYNIICFKEYIHIKNPNTRYLTHKIFGEESKSDKYIIITYYVEGVDLFDFVAKRIKYTKNIRNYYWEIYQLFYQMAYAVKEIHDLGIAHNDIKTENFLYNTHTVYLADFGFACPVTEQLSKELNIPICKYHSRGTPEYASPETFTGKERDLIKSDIYSLGVTFFAMLYFTFPYFSDNPYDYAYRDRLEDNTKIMVDDPDLDVNIKSLILKMLDQKPENRPNDKTIFETIKLVIYKSE